MRHRSSTPRKLLDKGVQLFSMAAALLGIFFLGWILFEVTRRGIAALNWDFFTKLPTPPGIEGGGLSQAIVGTLLITLLACAMGVPLGMLAGVYLSEFGKKTRLGGVVRYTINVMMGIPSIIIGLFVYTILVLPFGHFSGFSGAVALAVIMLPVVARTTEDMLVLIPNAYRESGLALGMPRWKVTLGIVFKAASSGLVTGTLLAVARVSGETAPLLFTALNSVYWPDSLFQPMGNLTVTIFSYAMSPYPDWQQAAWGASLLIMAAVLALTIVARTIFREKRR